MVGMVGGGEYAIEYERQMAQQLARMETAEGMREMQQAQSHIQMAQQEAMIERFEQMEEMQEMRGHDVFRPMGPSQMPFGPETRPHHPAHIDPPNQFLEEGGITKGVKQIDPQTGHPPFPDNTMVTQGGYKIVFMNDPRGFNVYSPDAKGFNDPPIASYTGGPHVNGPDGKELMSVSDASDFHLPDGTTLAIGTTGKTGATSVSSIDIVSGEGHVSANWDTTRGSFTVGSPADDGVEYMLNHIKADNWSHDTFYLNPTTDKDGKKITQIYEVERNKELGLVTGGKQTDDGAYVANVDPKQKNYALFGGGPIKPGDEGYGNVLLSEMYEVLSDPKYANSLSKDEIAELTNMVKKTEEETEAGEAGGAGRRPEDIIEEMKERFGIGGHNQRYGGNYRNSAEDTFDTLKAGLPPMYETYEEQMSLQREMHRRR